MSELSNKLKQLIKATPGILLVRLADLADCDVDVVHVELADAIRRGEVLSEKTDGPNGHKTQAFRLNPTFLGWGTPLQAANFRCSLAAVIPSATNTTPTQPVESKVDKAIAYLEIHGSATSNEMRVAMGLSGKHWPQQYLAYPMKIGRIVRDGDIFSLGNNDGVKRLRRASTTPVAATNAPSVAYDQAYGEDTIALSIHADGLQITLWERSGHMMLSANGNAIALTPGQVRTLTMFVGFSGAAHG